MLRYNKKIEIRMILCITGTCLYARIILPTFCGVFLERLDTCMLKFIAGNVPENATLLTRINLKLFEYLLELFWIQVSTIYLLEFTRINSNSSTRIRTYSNKFFENCHLYCIHTCDVYSLFSHAPLYAPILCTLESIDLSPWSLPWSLCSDGGVLSEWWVSTVHFTVQ